MQLIQDEPLSANPRRSASSKRIAVAIGAWQIRAMRSRPLRNFHVPIPEETYARLRAEAVKARRPATGLAREAIERWLTERERVAVHESVAEYACAMAGTAADLDEVLERAASEELERTTRPRRR